MILKGSQRGGASALGKHLLNSQDNEHVELHEIRGFVADDLMNAMREAYAVSKGTKCKQHLFSVSLSPPETETVPVDVFEQALERIEERNKLSGHPRVVVFHEKEGRRHCHAAWSRIDADKMTAVNMAFFKTKLRDLSREIYLEQGWKMPRGLMDSKARDPLNYSLEEYQQSERIGINARELKRNIQDCWAVSDSKASFEQAMKERGLYLAKGDRRRFVALHAENLKEVLSVARYTDQKTKDVKARLGNPKDLKSVDEKRAELAQALSGQYQRLIDEQRSKSDKAMAPLTARRQARTSSRRQERQKLDDAQARRWEEKSRLRSARLNTGLKGLWQFMSGKAREIKSQNEHEAWQALERDRSQRHDLIRAQLNERQNLQTRIQNLRQQHTQQMTRLHKDIAANEKLKVPETENTSAKTEFSSAARGQEHPKAISPQVKPSPNREIERGAQASSATPTERLEALRQNEVPQRHQQDKGPDRER